MSLNIDSIRAQFPILNQNMGENKLCYLDSTATTQKPLCVIDTMDRFYREEYSSVSRGVYQLSEKTTQRFEGVRKQVATFLNAAKEEEIIFTRGTTESINLVAQTWGRANLNEGDEIIVSALEHHANIVPWQILAQEKKAVLKVIPCTDDGDLILDAYRLLLTDKTKLVAVNHVANSIGTENDILKITALAKEVGATVLIDGAQSTAHLKVDLQQIGCDFFAFSGHKIYGPSGIGVLYGRYELLEKMPPFHGGGEMIEQVTFEKTTYAAPPARFEAGTPAVAEVIGLGEALKFINEIGLEEMALYEEELLNYAKAEMKKIPGLKLIGNAKKQSAIQSFTMEGAHAHDIGMIMDEEGIAIRTGHHCAQPVMDRFGVPATARVSFGVYNTKEEVDRFIKALIRVNKLFG